MRTIQQKMEKLRNQVKLGAKISRGLLGLLVISIILNCALITKAYEQSNLLNKPCEVPTIVGTGSLEQIDDSTFKIVEDIEVDDTLPPLPSNLK